MAGAPPHATRTDHDCSPLFPQSNPVDMALGVATGAGAVCLILLALYLYRRVTYARVEERLSVATETLALARRPLSLH